MVRSAVNYIRTSLYHVRTANTVLDLARTALYHVWWMFCTTRGLPCIMKDCPLLCGYCPVSCEDCPGPCEDCPLSCKHCPVPCQDCPVPCKNFLVPWEDCPVPWEDCPVPWGLPCSMSGLPYTLLGRPCTMPRQHCHVPCQDYPASTRTALGQCQVCPVCTMLGLRQIMLEVALYHVRNVPYHARTASPLVSSHDCSKPGLLCFGMQLHEASFHTGLSWLCCYCKGSACHNNFQYPKQIWIHWSMGSEIYNKYWSA